MLLSERNNQIRFFVTSCQVILIFVQMKKLILEYFTIF